MPARSQVELDSLGRSQVADQDLVPCRRRVDRGSGAGHSGEGLQCGVDLTEFNAPATQLDLFIRPALEDQAGYLVADEVAGTVRPFPPEGRAWARTFPRLWPDPGTGPARRRR